MVSLSHWAVAPAVKLGVFGLSRVGAAVAMTNGRRSGAVADRQGGRGQRGGERWRSRRRGSDKITRVTW
jgi:hypothetical protein